MANSNSPNKAAFVAKALLAGARVVHVYFLHESRNEWVNWNGDTDKVIRASPYPHPSAELAQASAERSQTPGTSFTI